MMMTRHTLLATVVLTSIAIGAQVEGQTKAPVALGDSYLRYTHPTIRQPIPDLLNLAVPPELEDRRAATLGYVDVTRAPFRADPSGASDSTRAIQAAIDFARDHQMVCFFPAGTYRVSDTLTATQQLYRRANGRVFGGNRFPNLLVGSRAGVSRPRIVLADRSPGFDDPAKTKIVLRFWARGYLNPTTADRVTDGLPPEVEQPNISMNQMLVNLDLVIGEGNPGAIAVRHQAAEGSGIEDCSIDATHGHTGIQGGIGSGGGSAGVTVIGGRIGLDFTGYLNGTQPTPTITGFTLINQTEAAIRSTSRQALVAAGLVIRSDRTPGPLVRVGGDARMAANHGELTIVDGRIEFTGAALQNPERVAVGSSRGVYLQNVYLQGATHAVVDPDQKDAFQVDDPRAWTHVKRFARPARPRTDQTVTYRYPVYRDGQSVVEIAEIASGEAPPDDLQARHLPAPGFPGFETPGITVVTDPPYNARGDGRSDDTEALQRALNEQEDVFLPRGIYLISKTLDLGPRNRLVGAGQHLSMLVPTERGAFGPDQPTAPLLRTADTDDARTAVAFLGLYAIRNETSAQALHWRSGGRSLFRAVEVRMATRDAATVLVTGHGGGNWYNYRGVRLVVDGARGPLRFYQFSPQKLVNEIRNARNVSIFGSKHEGNVPMLMVSDSDHIALYGHGGNGKGRPDGTLFQFDRSPNFLFANAVDGPTRIGSRTASHPEGSTDPNQWHMLIDDPTDGPVFKLPPLERPVLYLRGDP